MSPLSTQCIHWLQYTVRWLGRGKLIRHIIFLFARPLIFYIPCLFQTQKWESALKIVIFLPRQRVCVCVYVRVSGWKGATGC